MHLLGEVSGARESTVVGSGHLILPRSWSLHTLLKFVIDVRVLRHSLVFGILMLLLVSFHFLVNHHDGVCWLVKQVLKVHRVMRDLLCFNSLIETKVIMPLLERIKGDIPIELSHRMRL